MINKYDDIINLPHYEPVYHKRMSKSSRAAQFAPFAALTGYNEAIKETERLTDKKIDITDEVREDLNSKLKIILDHIKEKPKISVTYFIGDKKKSGGKYVNIEGNVVKIDSYKKSMKLDSNKVILFDDIVKIEGYLFEKSLKN